MKKGDVYFEKRDERCYGRFAIYKLIYVDETLSTGLVVATIPYDETGKDDTKPTREEAMYYAHATLRAIEKV